MTVLSLIAQIKAKPGKEGELEQLLHALIAPTREEAGSINYDLHVANDEPGLFVLYENWRTDALWQEHMASAHIKAFQARTDELVADWKLLKLTKIA